MHPSFHFAAGRYNWKIYFCIGKPATLTSKQFFLTFKLKRRKDVVVSMDCTKEN